MMTSLHPHLIALAGGSGAGKTWLAERVLRVFGPISSRISLDDFYHDRAHLPPSRRAKINFDHPRAIDWPFLELVLRDCRAGRPTQLPQYNFATHARLDKCKRYLPTPLVLVDGLWLFWRARVRRLFDLRIYLECPTQLRLERRLARDVNERQRSADSVREQFWRTVMPMHECYVAPQVRWADRVLDQPSSEEEIRDLTRTLRALLVESEPPVCEELYPTPVVADCRVPEATLASTGPIPGAAVANDPVPPLKTAVAAPSSLPPREAPVTLSQPNAPAEQRGEDTPVIPTPA
jgi:uridine kinase